MKAELNKVKSSQERSSASTANCERPLPLSNSKAAKRAVRFNRKEAIKHMLARPESFKRPVVAVAETVFPVITTSNTAFQNITLKDGQRCLIVPTIGGVHGLLGVQILSSSLFWQNEQVTLSIARDNLQSGTAVSAQWGNAGNQYVMTADANKQFITAPVRGTDYTSIFVGVEPSSNQGSSKVNLASGSFDLEVASTYLANARVIMMSTDELPGFKQLQESTTSQDLDFGFKYRRSLLNDNSQAEESLLNLINYIPPEIVGPGQQRYFSSLYRTVAPQWWRSGRGTIDTGSDGITNFQAGQIPWRNPYFHMHVTGCFAIVEAIGGDVFITAKMARTNHVEFLHSTDESSSSTTVLTQALLAGKTHLTEIHPNIQREDYTTRLGRVASGRDEYDADRKLEDEIGLLRGSIPPISTGNGTIHPPPSGHAFSLYTNEITPEDSISQVGSTSGSWLSSAKSGAESVLSIAKTTAEIVGVVNELMSLAA